AGALEVAALVVRPGVCSSRAQRVMQVAELAELSCALPKKLLRSRPVAFLPGGVGDHEPGEASAPGIPELPVELERLAGPAPSRRNVPACQRHVGGTAESFGADRGGMLGGVERALQTTAALDQ